MDLTGQVAIVTGSSRGLGKAMALTFARAGARVVVAARTEEPNPRIVGTIHRTAEEVRAEGGIALAVRCNVAVPEEVEALGRRTLEEFGRVDILVHNAAANFPGGVTETDLRRWEILWAVNVRALFLLAKAVLPAMKAQGRGHIVSVSPPPSSTGGSEVAFGGVYSLSKQTATRLALGMAGELRPHGVAVNCLWPEGRRWTEGVQALGRVDPEALAPQLFADAALALVAKDPRSYTGQAVTDKDVLREEGITEFSRYALPSPPTRT